MTADFYRAFEERHRGPRELIAQRLRVYLPFVQALQAQQAQVRALDLGCGRGEWLELLRAAHCQVQGVDLDPAMLEPCQKLGLPVQQADALEFLRGTPDASQTVVSAFHVVEHIGFEQVYELVCQALRVLQPGGLLILETPNPENLVVGTSSFYLDPTHQRPLPPQLLAFVPEHAGFARSKILRLQHDPDLLQHPAPTLWQVLNGASPDYAVVAQKAGPAPLIEALDPAFAAEHGLALETLAQRQQQHSLDRIEQAATSASQAAASASQAQAQASQAQARAEQAATSANQAQAQAEQASTSASQAQARAEQAQAAASQAQVRIEQLFASTSWRITAPLRAVSQKGRWLLAGASAWITLAPGSRPQRLAKRIVLHAHAAVASRPTLRRLIVSVAQRLGLYAALRRLYGRYAGWGNDCLLYTSDAADE